MVITRTCMFGQKYDVEVKAWQMANVCDAQRGLRATKRLVGQKVGNFDFSTSQTLASDSTATDRGGNERAVNVAKRSWFLKRIFQKNSSAKLMDDSWMTWSFQCNFMYDPIL